MPVPTQLSDLSSTIASNSPAGGDNPSGQVDDYFRAGFGIVRQLYAERTAVASASTVDLSAYPERLIPISGTTTITSLGTVAAGITKVLRFQSALVLTHNATSLILPGAANITTAAGDQAEFKSEGSGNWRCMWYTPASGNAIVPGASQGADSYMTAKGTVISYYGSDATGAYVSVSGANSFRLKINGSADFFVNGNRNLIIGTGNGTDFANVGRIQIQYNGASVSGIVLKDSAGTGSAYPLSFYNSAGTAVGSVFHNNSTTTYNTSSDARLKRNIRPAPDLSDVLKRISVVDYEWLYTGEPGRGVIAQELEAVVPEAVSQMPDGFKGVDYSKIVPYLVSGLQSALKRLDAAGL